MSNVFRPSMTREELELTREALLFYSKKLETEWNGQPSSVQCKKVLSAQKLCYNFKLFLAGEKKTGRRRNFDWREKL